MQTRDRQPHGRLPRARQHGQPARCTDPRLDRAVRADELDLQRLRADSVRRHRDPDAVDAEIHVGDPQHHAGEAGGPAHEPEAFVLDELAHLQLEVVQVMLGQRGPPLRRAARRPAAPAQRREQLGDRARMEAGEKQPADGLAVRPDLDRPQAARPVGRVQPPVLLQFPGQEPEHARDARGNERHDRQCQPLLHAGRGHELPGHHGNHRHEQLVRHRDDGEMFDRVELRLDEQRDAEPDAGIDHRPGRGQHRLHRQGRPRLAGAEAELLVHRVQRPLHGIHGPAEEVDDPGDEPREDVDVELVYGPPDPLHDPLLGEAADPGIEQGRDDREQDRRQPGRAPRNRPPVVRQAEPDGGADDERAGEVAAKPGHGQARQHRGHGRQPQQPGGNCDDELVGRRAGHPHRPPQRQADRRYVEQAPEQQADREHPRRRVDVPGFTERIRGQRLDDVIDTVQRDPCRAEGKEQMRRQ